MNLNIEFFFDDILLLVMTINAQYSYKIYNCQFDKIKRRKAIFCNFKFISPSHPNCKTEITRKENLSLIIVMDARYQERPEYQRICMKCKSNFNRKLSSYIRYFCKVKQKIKSFKKQRKMVILPKILEYKLIERSNWRNENAIDRMNTMRLIDDIVKRMTFMMKRLRNKNKSWKKYMKNGLCQENHQVSKMS